MSRKFIVLVIGIFFSSFGVGLSLKSNLGATPIGVCPAVFSDAVNISTGTAMAVLLGIFFVMQILILKKDFRPFQLLQLFATLIYGVFVDLSEVILSYFSNDELWQRSIYCVLGIVILAFGVFVMLSTDFIMLPQDAAVAVISNKYKKEYGKIKITLDVILTTIATASSFVIFSRIIHVGVGTILAAIFVGKIISLLQKSAGINRFISWAIGD